MLHAKPSVGGFKSTALCFAPGIRGQAHITSKVIDCMLLQDSTTLLCNTFCSQVCLEALCLTCWALADLYLDRFQSPSVHTLESNNCGEAFCVFL